MNPEERSLLERTYKMVEENNTILRSIRRATRFSLVFKSIYWFIIIGLSIGAFYYIQPYVNFMMGALNIGDKTNGAKSVQGNVSQSYVETLQDLLK